MLTMSFLTKLFKSIDALSEELSSLEVEANNVSSDEFNFNNCGPTKIEISKVSLLSKKVNQLRQFKVDVLAQEMKTLLFKKLAQVDPISGELRYKSHMIEKAKRYSELYHTLDLKCQCIEEKLRILLRDENDFNENVRKHVASTEADEQLIEEAMQIAQDTKRAELEVAEAAERKKKEIEAENIRDYALKLRRLNAADAERKAAFVRSMLDS